LVFFGLAIAAAGLPPLSGFLGKAMLLQAAGLTANAGWIIFGVLASSLLIMVAFARCGSTLFWKSALDTSTPWTPAARDASDMPCAGHAVHRISLGLLGVLIVACTALAGPVARYAAGTADQLLERQTYISAVLYTAPVPAAIDVRREMRERKTQAVDEHHQPAPGNEVKP
jgi:multicomponent K+:H+ antiporter subunit D